MELLSQDVGKDHAREVRGVFLPLPRRQLQPGKRQGYFPRAQSISFRASPNPVMCPVCTAHFFVFPQGIKP